MKYRFSTLERVEKERDNAQEAFEKAWSDTTLHVESDEEPNDASWSIEIEPVGSAEGCLLVTTREGVNNRLKHAFYIGVDQAQAIQEYLEDWCTHIRWKKKDGAENKRIKEKHEAELMEIKNPSDPDFDPEEIM